MRNLSGYQEIPREEIKSFITNCGKIIEAFEDTARAAFTMSPKFYALLKETPAYKYAAANYPLGKSQRKFKKWRKKNEMVNCK